MRAYREYSSPKAARSPCAAARTKASSKLWGVAACTSIIIYALVEHRFDFCRRERLHRQLGVQAVDTVRPGAHQSVGELGRVPADDLDHPLAFLGPLLGQSES